MANDFNFLTIKERIFAQDEKLIKTAIKISKIIETEVLKTNQSAIPQTLIVGGFIRDAVLEQKPKDLDLEVFGVEAAKLEELLHKIFPNIVNTVGRSFGIYKIRLDNETEIDVSIPRRESKTGKGHSGFTVIGDPTMSIQDAAKRRDFTINTISVDPLTGKIFDYYNGLNDLKNKILRVTDPDHFSEDPLRVYRALQLVARFNLSVENSSFNLMQKMVQRDVLNELAKERITDEFKKMLLKGERPSLGLELAKNLGLISKYFPELYALNTTDQDTEWHPEGNVWTHTLMVVDEAAKIIRQSANTFDEDESLQILLGALCHDLGKPKTTKLYDNRLRSLGHESAGLEPAKIFCHRFTFNEIVQSGAIAITTEHLKITSLYREKTKGILDNKKYSNAVRKLLKRIYPVSWRVLLAASLADYRGRDIKDAKQNEFFAGIIFEDTIIKEKLDQKPTESLIQGHDLLNLGLKPGPIISKIIQQIENARDRDEISTRKEALDLVKEILEKP